MISSVYRKMSYKSLNRLQKISWMLLYRSCMIVLEQTCAEQKTTTTFLWNAGRHFSRPTEPVHLSIPRMSNILCIPSVHTVLEEIKKEKREKKKSSCPHLYFGSAPWHSGDVAHDIFGCHRLPRSALSAEETDSMCVLIQYVQKQSRKSVESDNRPHVTPAQTLGSVVQPKQGGCLLFIIVFVQRTRLCNWQWRTSQMFNCHLLMGSARNSSLSFKSKFVAGAWDYLHYHRKKKNTR